MKIRSIIHIIALGILLVASSCSKENLIDGGGKNPLPEVPDGMVRLELITNSGDYEEPATRAVGDKLIKTPWVLVFKDTGTPANDLFVEAQQATIINGISYVLLTKTTETAPADRKRRLLVIANSEKFRTATDPNTEIVMSEVNFNAQLKPAGVSKTFAQAVELLLTSAPLATPQTTVPYTPDEPIPMSVEYKLPSGITENTRIGGSESGDTPLKLRRAVAKVTVAVSADPAVGGFVLHGATVVDAPRDGYLCPASTLKNNTGNLTDYLTSPSGDGVTGIAPAEDVAGNITTAAHPIYVYESGAGGTSVIIKGTYKGMIGYYRLAFLDNDNANAPMSILRNTHYQFNIVKVTGTGYPSVAEAKKNPPAHDILAKIEVSDDKSHDIISNGRYYMGCSNSEFLVYADGAKSNLIALTITTNATAAEILADGTNSITATTTSGSAMTVSPAKITLNTSGAAKGTETEVKVTLPVGFTASSVGTITLKLGNLVKTIKVQRQPMLSYVAASKEFATNYVSGKVTAGGEWLSLGVVNDPEQGSAQVTRPDQQGSVYLFTKCNVAASGAQVRTGGELYLARHNNQGRVKVYIEQEALNNGGFTDILCYDKISEKLYVYVGQDNHSNTPPVYNMVYFKFGSVIGFIMDNSTISTPWDRADKIVFNVTGATTYGTYGNIPCYTSADWDAGIINVSSPSYHNGNNVKIGKGDPCKLAGLKAIDIRTMTAAQIDAYNSGWRLPTDIENADFTGLRGAGVNTGYNDNTYPFCEIIKSIFGGKVTYGWFPIGGTNGTNQSGRFLNAQINNGNINSRLLAAGYRNTNGTNVDLNLFGYYWSSVPSNKNNSSALYFLYTTVYPRYNLNYSSGCSIRCVRD